MAVRITITPDEGQQRKLQAAFERLAKVGRNPRAALGRIGLYIRREAQRALRTRPKDWGSPSGRLSRSLAIRLDDMSVEVGSNLVYAAIQQEGGTVVPRGHKYLAIAVLPHLRRRGVWPRDLPAGSMKFVKAAEIRIGNRSWRGPALVRATEALGLLEGSVAGGKYRQSRDAAGRYAKGGKRDGASSPRGSVGEVMFALVKQVRIRGRPYLTFDSRAQAFALAQFEAEFQRAIGGG